MPTQGTTIVFDDFTDGGRTNGLDATDIQWYAGRENVALSVEEDIEIGGGNALQMDSSTTFSRFVGLFDSGVTIGVGQVLELTFDLRFATAPADGSGLLRVGIFNDGGTALSGDGTGTQTDDFGYGMTSNPGSDSPTGTRIATEVSGNSILGGAPPSGLVSTGNSGASIDWGTTPHSVQYSIARLEDGSLDVSTSIDGGVSATANIASPINGSYTFNEVAIGQGNTNRDLVVDNVVLRILPELTTDPVITSFTAIGDGVWEIQLLGSPSISYQFLFAAALDFSSGSPEVLSQGDPETTPGVIAESGDSVVTDANGMATVRIVRASDSVGFVRAQTLP